MANLKGFRKVQMSNTNVSRKGVRETHSRYLGMEGRDITDEQASTGKLKKLCRGSHRQENVGRRLGLDLR